MLANDPVRELNPLKPDDVYWIYDAEPGIDHLHVILTHPEPVDGELKVGLDKGALREEFFGRVTDKSRFRVPIE
ncbi:hypothetical protein BH11ARM2_BH11ARM2_16190 [soil metagenome]